MSILEAVSPAVTEGVGLKEIPLYSVHLDAVRGAAAMMVFLWHVHFIFLPSMSRPPTHGAGLVRPAMPPPSAALGMVDPAHEAVMIFFVLSGFLVGGSVVRILKQRQWSWRRYLLHRTVRLWMVLLPALLLGLVLDTAGSHHFAGQGTVYSTAPRNEGWIPSLKDRLRPSTLAGNVFFLQELRVSPLGTNQPLWSLTNEFWYYLAFPCLALAVLGRVAVWKRLLAAAVMSVILLFVGRSIAVYFSIWLLGVVAAVVPLKIPIRLCGIFTALALVLLLVVNMPIQFLPRGRFSVDLMVAMAFLFLLYCILHFKGASRDGIYRRSARFTSKVSFSLYLTHAPVLCLMSAVLVGSYRVLPLNGRTFLLLSEVIAIALAVAFGVHYLFEAQTNRVRNFIEARL